MNTLGWMESVWQDLRYGGRQLRLSPGFTLVAIASLAMGIGANTAIFELLDAVRLRSLPVRNPHELAEVRIAGGNGGLGLNQQYGQMTYPLWQEVKHTQQSFSGIFAWNLGEVAVGQGSELYRGSGLSVSGDFFRVLGVEPFRGRLILPEDESTCPESVAVVSFAYWQSRMGGRELESGAKLMINGRFDEVVGVTPPGFLGLAVGEHFDVALPLCRPKEPRRDLFTLSVMGRLGPGWTPEKASAQLAALSPGIMAATALIGYAEYSTNKYKNSRLAAYPAAAGVSNLRDEYDSSLWLLLAITGLVLLIACANLANLMLARASTREREMAVRLAIGASRGRLLRQLLAESAMLAVIGVAIGSVLARSLSRILVWSLSTERNSVTLPIGTDWRVLLFLGVIGMLTCIIFGTLPALRAARTDPGTAMKAGGRGSTGSRERFSWQRVLVVAQVSISLVLLAGALLFVRSFRNLLTLNPGMREEGITFGQIGFQQAGIAQGKYPAFVRELLDEARSTPGVLNAAITTFVPLAGGAWSHGIDIGTVADFSRFAWVSPEYLETMGIPLLTGRGISPQDSATSQRVAVVNQAFVRRFLGQTNPIGHAIGQMMRTSPEPDYPSTVYQIVGVIADTKYNDLRGEPEPMTLAPMSQFPNPGPWVVMMIYSNVPPEKMSTAVKQRIASHHPGLILDFRGFQSMIRDGLVRERMMATLSGIFGVLAAVLAMVGLYGVISYLVARRRNEIGIRMALGASRGLVLGMVMREAGWLLLIGIVTGTALALIAGRGTSSLLFGLKPHDPMTLISAAGLLAAIAALASFLPARRASLLDPMVALREE